MFEKDEKEALCCCEYIDIHNERNHILACCCNCSELDEGFDKLISGKKVPSNNITEIMVICKDRIRIPWPGGAKNISLDIFMPCIIIPALLLVATLSLWNTVFTFLFMIFSLFILKRKMSASRMFFTWWTVISFTAIYLIFELLVIPFLEILISENVAVNILIAVAVISARLMKIRTNHLSKRYGTQCSTFNIPQLQECTVCQTYVPEKDFHCVWLNCCIGQHNRSLYLIFLLMTIAALLYSSNLTLTTICHPFNIYKTILFPDDCSEVYFNIELALSFVSAVYSLIITTYLFYLFIHESLLITLGVTGEEWNSLPSSQSFRCGLCTKRPYSRGFALNWSRIFWN